MRSGTEVNGKNHNILARHIEMLLTTKQCFKGVCGCYDPSLYSEECGWDGGDCEGMEEICEEIASFNMATNSFAVDSQQFTLLTFLAAAFFVL